jgi:hypothetical protein
MPEGGRLRKDQYCRLVGWKPDQGLFGLIRNGKAVADLVEKYCYCRAEERQEAEQAPENDFPDSFHVAREGSRRIVECPLILLRLQKPCLAPGGLRN